jgi:hypothetical protein
MTGIFRANLIHNFFDRANRYHQQDFIRGGTNLGSCS